MFGVSGPKGGVGGAVPVKRVKVSELQPGMYIHDLNCSYLQHGFVLPRFLIKKPEQIEKMVRSGLVEVLIDTDRGEDVRPVAAVRATAPAAPPSPLSRPTAPPPARVSQREESAVARKVMGEAQGVVQDMLHDVRLGRQVEPERAGAVVAKINESVLRNPGAMLSLCRIKEADNYTFQHCVSVCALLVAFANAVGLDAAAVQQAGLGGMLHDVGKMRVPLEILNKPGKLTDEEFAVMKSHAALSRELLEGLPGVSTEVIQIAGEHHEKVGGRGYPLGLEGEGISLLGRMAAIVDVYDAITSNRVYHKGMEPSEALTKLLEWSGSHLDPTLVQKFIRVLGIYPVGALVRLDSGRLAVVVEQQENLLTPTVRLVFDANRGLRLAAQDLDLGRGNDRIDCYEDPEPWGITPKDYL